MWQSLITLFDWQPIKPEISSVSDYIGQWEENQVRKIVGVAMYEQWRWNSFRILCGIKKYFIIIIYWKWILLLYNTSQPQCPYPLVLEGPSAQLHLSPMHSPFSLQTGVGLLETTTKPDKTGYSKSRQNPSYWGWRSQPNMRKKISRVGKWVRETPAHTVRSPTKTTKLVTVTYLQTHAFSVLATSVSQSPCESCLFVSMGHVLLCLPFLWLTLFLPPLLWAKL